MRGCRDGRLALLENHSALAACGRTWAIIGFNGSILANHTLPHELWSLDVAESAGILAVGTLAAVDLIELRTGALLQTVETGYSGGVRSVSIDSSGRLLAFGAGLRGVVVDLDAGAERSYGSADVGSNPGGDPVWSIKISRTGTRIWVMEGETLHLFLDLNETVPWTTVQLEGTASSSETTGVRNIYGGPEEDEVTYVRMVEARENVSDRIEPAGDTRVIVYSHGLVGQLLRGMEIPSGEIFVETDQDGGIYAVSLNRLVIGGAEMVLTYGLPTCSPPILVRHNITA
jgi:hypothetical protein